MTDLELATSRTWTEINLDDLAHNVKILRSILNPTAKFLGVVKANAYGHGIIPVAKKLTECGADWLAVAAIPCGIELRENGITLPVLCLGQTQPEFAELITRYNISQAVGDLENGRALSKLAGSHKINIHVKIDTGMSRTGFYWPDDKAAQEKAANEIYELYKLPNLEPEGMFTHFAAADDDPEFTRLQLRKFNEAKEALAKLGINFKIYHAAASVGVMNYPEAHFNMGRFGLVLYGYESTETGNTDGKLGLRPVMTLKSRITAVRDLPAGATISYGRTYTLKRDSKIAVLPIGYADGWPRNLSNNFSVKIHDTLCPNLGRVCMDMTMIDVTDLCRTHSVKAGDVAVVMDGELIIDAARNSGTIIHEMVCRPSLRVPRIYIESGKLRV
ncbi:MAG: alanine racemase [Synergistaceae bacterium]|nr:alanine racemase [Synergistaceae bacterium]